MVFPKSERYPNGKTFDLGHPKRAKTFLNGVTGEVTKILAQNVTGGTGGRAQIQCPSAGKTGTTDNFRDAWYSGFTPRLATSVWVGYPDRQIEMRSQFFGAPVAGGSFPAAIWGSYMKVAMAGKPCGEWKKITEPVTAAAFKGRYARSGGEGTGDETGTTPDDPTATSRMARPTSRGPRRARRPVAPAVAARPATSVAVPVGPAARVARAGAASRRSSPPWAARTADRSVCGADRRRCGFSQDGREDGGGPVSASPRCYRAFPHGEGRKGRVRGRGR